MDTQYAIESFSKRLEQLEMVNINLMNGYAELVVIVEALMTQTLAPLEDEARAEFILELKKSQMEMTNLLQSTAKHLIEKDREALKRDMDASSGGTTSTMENVPPANDSSSG